MFGGSGGHASPEGESVGSLREAATGVVRLTKTLIGLELKGDGLNEQHDSHVRDCTGV